LSKRLLNQGFIETRQISILNKFFGRYHHLTLPYRVSVTTLTSVGHDIVVISTCHSFIWHRDIMAGAECGAVNVYPSGTPDSTSGFYVVLPFVSITFML